MRKISLVAAGFVLAVSSTAHADGLSCPKVGEWMDARTGAVISSTAAIKRLATADVVLLGESHGVPDVQLWQAATAASIADARGGAQFAYEMLPRSVQGALDAWAKGESDRSTFLTDANWAGNWGYPPASYDPIMRLPRLRGEPAIALNLDRSLIRRITRDGLESVPVAERQGVSQPAPALPEYVAWLREVLNEKMARGAEGGAPASAESDPEAALERLTAGQLVWDRAFADAIVAARATAPQKPVIGFMGRGHVEYGHGAPHQLDDLGVEKLATAVPIFQSDDCKLETDAAGRPIADLAYGAPAYQHTPQAPRPRIGVFIENAEGGGALISRVVEDSPAEKAGFEAGDVITSAAGSDIGSAAELGRAIRLHSWGAWLPFGVTRGDEKLELVAKLPAVPPS